MFKTYHVYVFGWCTEPIGGAFFKDCIAQGSPPYAKPMWAMIKFWLKLIILSDPDPA